MAAQPIIYLANCSVVFRVIGAPETAREYKGNLTSAAVVPAAGEESSIVTLDGETHTRYGPATFALQITAAQDWSEFGLSTFLWEHAGEDCAFAIKAYPDPLSTNHPQIAGTCILREGAYGGEAETWITAEVEMPCKGKPVLQFTLPTGTRTGEEEGYTEGDVEAIAYPPPPNTAVLPDPITPPPLAADEPEPDQIAA